MKQTITYFEVDLADKFEPRAARHYYFQATSVRLTALICHLLDNVCHTLFDEIDPVKLEFFRTDNFQLSKKSIVLRFEINDVTPSVTLNDGSIIVSVDAYSDDQSALLSECETISYFLQVIAKSVRVLNEQLGGDFSALTKASQEFAENGWIYRKRLGFGDQAEGTERWLEVDMHTYRIQIEKPLANGENRIVEYWDLGLARINDVLLQLKEMQNFRGGAEDFRKALSACPLHLADSPLSDHRIYPY